MTIRQQGIYYPTLPQQGEVVITGDDYNHLAHSLRAKVGDIFRLFNGNGNFASAQIDSIKRTEIKAKIVNTEDIDNTPKVRLTLAFGILPASPLRTLLAGATQLGVVEFRPFMSSFNDIRIKPDDTNRIIERLKRIIVENCAVAGRSHLPSICNPMDLKKCVEDSSLFNHRLVFWEEGGIHWGNVLPLNKGNVIAVIGPKGGLSEEEIDFLKENNFEILSFGETILKAEIAAIAACARIIKS